MAIISTIYSISCNNFADPKRPFFVENKVKGEGLIISFSKEKKNRKSVFMRYSENAGVSWENGDYFYLCLQYSAVCLQILPKDF